MSAWAWRSPPSPPGADPAPLLADLRRVFADAAANGVPPELVEASKRQEMAQLAFATDSISGLATSWSNALAFAGAQSPDDVAKAYAAVTPADVNRLARSCWTRTTPSPPSSRRAPPGSRRQAAGSAARSRSTARPTTP